MVNILCDRGQGISTRPREQRRGGAARPSATRQYVKAMRAGGPIRGVPPACVRSIPIFRHIKAAHPIVSEGFIQDLACGNKILECLDRGWGPAGTFPSMGSRKCALSLKALRKPPDWRRG